MKDVLARYDIMDTIGVGGFSEVKRARDRRTKEMVAVKVGSSWLQHLLLPLHKVLSVLLSAHRGAWCRGS